MAYYEFYKLIKYFFYNVFRCFRKLERLLVKCLIVFIFFFIAFIIKDKCFAANREWSDTEISSILNRVANIQTYTNWTYQQLQDLNASTDNIESDVDNILDYCQQISNYSSNINEHIDEVEALLNQLNTMTSRLYTEVNSILLKIDTVEYNIINRIDMNSSETHKLLQELIDTLKGNEEKQNVTTTTVNNINTLNGKFVTESPHKMMYFAYDSKLSYELHFEWNVSGSSYYTVSVYTSNEIPANGNSYIARITGHNLSQGSTFDYTVSSGLNCKYICVRIYNTITCEVTSVEGNVGLSGVQDSINQQGDNINQSITNDNVDMSSNTLPSNDTHDITATGFDSIFTTLYNTFTSSNSNDVVLPIPFTDQSITINYNTVFGKFAGGFVFTFVRAFWYYIISLYIVKDIAIKIKKIKEGNIEDIETTNIKEDLL